MLTKAVGCNGRKTSGDLILDLYDPCTTSRHHVEDFIHQVFARAYNADLKHYLSRLMALQSKDNRIVAALGMQQACSGPLFLEAYLDTPIEDVISQLHNTGVNRNQIMEVGNLASVHRGGLRQLIVALTSYLSGAGIEWVVFTAVPAVRNAFAALGLDLQPLTQADKSRLNETEQASWGRYYETGPMVVAGRVEEGYQRLGELIELEKVMSMSCYLWQYAFAVGCQQRILNVQSYN
ncbi:thermostable hemolysin [Kaarinaea lacus]